MPLPPALPAARLPALLLLTLALTACTQDSPAPAAGQPLTPVSGQTFPIDAGVANAYEPQVATDANGNALAVWMQSDGARLHVWGNRYTPAGGWGTPVQLDTGPAGDALSPRLALDGNGNALVVWYQSDDSRTSVWSTRYTAGSGWGGAALLETDDTGDAIEPAVAVNASGAAVVAWAQSDGSRYNLWANHYAAGSWSGPQLIESDDGGDARGPAVALDGSGNAVVVWAQSDGTRMNIWANRLSAGAWGSAQLLESDDGGDALTPRVAVDGAGNALAVWTQNDGSRFNIVANRYTAGGGWAGAALIETNDAGPALSPQIAFTSGGEALAVWAQSDGSRYGLWANRHGTGGWAGAQQLDTGNGSVASQPRLAADGSGNAVAVWAQNDGTRIGIWSSRYRAGSGWAGAQRVETGSRHALTPHVAVNAAGTAVVVWEQSDGTRFNVLAGRAAADGAWSAAVPVEGLDRGLRAGNAANATLAVNGQGHAVAVWEQYDGSRHHIWANLYQPSVGWRGAVRVEEGPGTDALSPQAAVDANGTVLLVWAKHDGGPLSIWSRRYHPVSGWSNYSLLETDDSGDAVTPQIGVDGSGNAMAVWAQSDGSRYSIWANRYTPAGGWGTATLIETDNSGDAQAPRLAVDGAGNAIAVWYQSDGSRYNLWANRYTPAGGWGTATLLESGSGSAYGPQLALDGNGNALAVWFQSDGSYTRIWASRFTAGSTSWSAPVRLSLIAPDTDHDPATNNDGSARDPQLAVDSAGNAIAVWYQSDGSHTHVWASRYSATTDTWGTAMQLDDAAGSAITPQVAVDGSGNALAVWTQSDGMHTSLRASAYTIARDAWSASPLVLARDSEADAALPQVRWDGSGHWLTLWQKWDGVRNGIWVNRY